MSIVREYNNLQLILPKNSPNSSNSNKDNSQLRDKPLLGLVTMVKNERKNILKTLKSVLGYVDAIIIYDTGSTDNTKEIITEFCETNKINLYMICGEFVNFEVSRNVLMDYADTINVDFILLLDTNDELVNGEGLLKFIQQERTTNTNGYLLCQRWKVTKDITDDFFNLRLFKNRNGWRFRGVVHEWLKDTLSETSDPRVPPYVLFDKQIIIYQDRTDDDNKSSERFKKDYELLMTEYKKNPLDGRTTFYLAQTCSCVGLKEDALYYYKMRTHLGGFQEEVYTAFDRAADIMLDLNHSWHDVMGYYIKAIEISERAEPYFKIARYYYMKQKYELAFVFIKRACELDIPNSLLFVGKHIYDVERWKLLNAIEHSVGRKVKCDKNDTVTSSQPNHEEETFITTCMNKFIENGISKELAHKKALELWKLRN